MLRSFTPTLQRTEGNSGSWRATLFFVYSRKVAFSSIRSQSGPRLQLVGFCSPKSAFVLAEKVRVFTSRCVGLEYRSLWKALSPSSARPCFERSLAKGHCRECHDRAFLQVCQLVRFLSPAPRNPRSPHHLTHPVTFYSHIPLLLAINAIMRRCRGWDLY
jgi:hypothetical protein